jgi:tetratricopeptide (TPR) repeat protein
VASCHKHPFEALFVAHRHLGDASPEVQLQALLLASEALWWLHHYADAQLAAETALRAHPRSTQALWRLSVAQYKAGHFEEAERNLDSLLATVNTFAPAWSLRGQTRVWLAPDKPSAGGSDFEAAHELDSTWPVPVRLSKPDFQKLVDAAVLESMADMRGAFQQPVVEIEMLPGIPAVAGGDDPDIRCSYFNPSYVGTRGPLGALGGDFAAGARRDIAPGARIVLYQRNIENLCGDPSLLSQEVTKSYAEALAGSMRIDATTVTGAPEVHAENADRPAADQL